MVHGETDKSQRNVVIGNLRGIQEDGFEILGRQGFDLGIRRNIFGVIPIKKLVPENGPERERRQQDKNKKEQKSIPLENLLWRRGIPIPEDGFLCVRRTLSGSWRKFGVLGARFFGHGIYFIPVPPHPTPPFCGGEGKGDGVLTLEQQST
jgi:hypothetical protein